MLKSRNNKEAHKILSLHILIYLGNWENDLEGSTNFDVTFYFNLAMVKYV